MQPPKPFFKSFESSFAFASPQYVVIASGGSNSCGPESSRRIAQANWCHPLFHCIVLTVMFGVSGTQKRNGEVQI